MESAASPTYAISLSGQLGCPHAAIRELAAILLFRESVSRNFDGCGKNGAQVGRW